MRYVKITQMGLSCLQTLDESIEMLKEAHKNALPEDVLEVRFVEMTEEEYEGLPEFEGF